MDRKQILDCLKTIHNGSYTKIRFISTIPSNKDNKGKLIQKITESVVRLGVIYNHIQVTEIQERKGEANSIHRLPWGEWDPEAKNYLIEHKDNYYLRCSTSRSPRHHGKVQYFIDGVEATKEEVMPLTRPSEWTDDRNIYVFSPNIENILAIGKEVK